METVDFLLVPDRAAARRVRRELATQQARLGVLVGTWFSLMDLALMTYVLTDGAPDWREELRAAMYAMGDAFWADSMRTAPRETIDVVEHALVDLIAALPPGQAIALPDDAAEHERAARHTADLAALQARLGGALPSRLAGIKRLLDAPADRAISRLAVHYIADRPPLSAWQLALLDKLAVAEAASDPAIDAVLCRALDQSPQAPPDTALGHLQRELFAAGSSSAATSVAQDDTVQFLAARDYLEELEVAAGMVQRATDTDPRLRPSDFGLLLPSDPRYATGAAEVFARVGIPLSGLRVEVLRRDLGREAVLLFLQTRRETARSMALASLFAHPLMPWSEQRGQSMAMKLMNRGRDFDPSEGLLDDGVAMVRLIQDSPQARDDVAVALEGFAERLSPPDELDGAVEAARELIDLLVAQLRESQPLTDGRDMTDELTGDDWRRLETMAATTSIHDDESSPVTREGVAVIAEHEEPWREVTRLIVVGFSADRFPSSAGTSPVFTDADVEWLREATGARLETGDELLARRRALLLRQLRSASDHVTVLLPRRDAQGGSLPESGTLTFMAERLEREHDADLPVIDLSTSDGLAAADGVAIATPQPATPPRGTVPASGELWLGRDLLDVRHLETGRFRYQSPSSLEYLIVSPLAWLLDRVGLRPRSWEPEEVSPAVRGTIAHEVFERLFPPGELPPTDGLAERVRRLLAIAVRQTAPFMGGGAWRVELLNLGSEIAQAAERWHAILSQLDARVVAAEQFLFGDHNGAKLTGKVDAVIALPDGVRYVVDYKKSKSGPRRERMEAGYDHQASLYRLMLLSRRPRADGSDALGAALSDARETGVMYFNMNDGVVLADTDAGGVDAIADARVLKEDISLGAMELIDERLREVRSGVVRLNREGDDKRFEKLKIGTYALDSSSLVGLLTLPEEGDEEATP